MPVTRTHIGLAGLIAATLLATPALASFHFWDIAELYSNADGSVQFIELSTIVNSQQFLTNHTIVASDMSAFFTNTFTFPGQSPSPTGGHSLLLATPGFGSLPGGVTPDFTIPAGFLFTGGGSVNFGESADIVSYGSLPTDGLLSFGRGGVITANSPTNFAGQTGSVPAPSTLLGVAMMGFGAARRRRR